MADGAPSPAPVAPARTRLVVAIAATVLVIDQLTKAWVVATLDHRTKPLVWKLQLRIVRNPGMAFSVGRGAGPVLGAISIVVVAVLVRFVRTPRSTVAAIGLALILGGAIGNLIDRCVRAPHGVLTGRVVDFIDLQFWPVFNVADMGVSIGVILILWEYGVARPPNPPVPERDGTGYRVGR